VVSATSLDARGDTLMHCAAGQGHRNVVKELFRRGADPHRKNYNGVTPYDIAHEYNYWELGDYIREKAGLDKLGPKKERNENAEASLGNQGPAGDVEGRDRDMKLKQTLLLLNGLDLDVLCSVADDASEGVNDETHAALVNKLHELRARLGDRRRAERLRTALGKVWARGAQLQDEDDGGSLAAEAEALAAKMSGRDIETLLKDVTELQHRLADDQGGQQKRASEERESKEALEEMSEELERLRGELVLKRAEVREARGAAEGISSALASLKEQELPCLTRQDVTDAVERRSGEDGSIQPSALGALVADLLSCAAEKGEQQRVAHHEASSGSKMSAVAQQELLEKEEKLRARVKELEASVAESNQMLQQAQAARVQEETSRKGLEAKLNAGIGEGEQAQQLSQQLLQLREEQGRALEVAAAKEAQWLRDLQEVSAERTRLEERLNAVERDEGALNGVRAELQRSRKESERLAAELRGSKIRAAANEIASARDRCGEMRRGLRGLRRDAASASQEMAGSLRRVAEEFALLCRFILPLPHQEPERALPGTATLSHSELVEALKHMVAKYRAAVRTARELNSRVQEQKGALQVRFSPEAGRLLTSTRATELAFTPVKASSFRTRVMTVSNLFWLQVWVRGGTVIQTSVQAVEGSAATAADGKGAASLRGGRALLLHYRGEGTVSVAEGSRAGLERTRGARDFYFDAAFPPGTGQAEMFEAAQGLFATALDGYRVAVLAYGPSGGGRTFALFGPDLERDWETQDDGIGLAPRFVRHVFEFTQTHGDILKVCLPLGAPLT